MAVASVAAAVAVAVATAMASAPAAPALSSPVLAGVVAGAACGWRTAAQRVVQDLAALPTSTGAGGGAVDPRVAAVRSALAAAGIRPDTALPAGCSSPAPTSGPGQTGGVSSGSGARAGDGGPGVGAANLTPGPVPTPDPTVAVLPLVAGTGTTTAVATSAQLQQAIAAARPGDTIRLAAGRYPAVAITGRSGTAQAPITLVGPRDAVIDGGSATGGYALHLQDASFWQLSGVTITGGGKGVVIDHGQHNLLDSLDIGRTGDEAVHLRAASSDNTLQRSTVHDTGLARPGFGEGAYLGSAKSNWNSVSGGQPDLSMRNRIVANTFHAITAENVDVKEATSGALITGNRFDGSAISGANYADSVVDVKGYDNSVTDNITTGASSALRTIITTHVITTPATSGCGNTITGNTVQGSLPAGGLVAVDPKCAAAAASATPSAATEAGAGATTGGQG